MKISKYTNVLCVLGGGVIAVTSLSSCQSDVGTTEKTNQSLNLHSKSYYTSLLSTKKQKAMFGSTGPMDDMNPNRGYSSDADGIALADCYKPSNITTAPGQSIIRVSQAEDYDSLEKNLDIGFNSKFPIKDQFVGNAMFKYLRKIEETAYSLTFNYYMKYEDAVNMNYSYNPKTVFTEDGANIYDNGENPYFRNICGDYVVKSYRRGAFVILSMKVNFKDKNERNEIKSKLGISYAGDLFSLSAKLKALKDQYHANMSLDISADQFGGDAGQLGKAIDPKALSNCNLENTTACQGLAASFASYVANNFSEQVKNPNSLVKIGKVEIGSKVSIMGIKLASSFVTPEVVAARNNLLTLNSQMNTNYENLSNVLYNYPVDLDPTYAKNVADARNIVYGNLDYLGTHSISECWDDTEGCPANAKNLIATKIKQLANKNLINGFADVISFNIFDVPSSNPFYPNKNNSLVYVVTAPSNTSSSVSYLIDGGGIYPNLVGHAHDSNPNCNCNADYYYYPNGAKMSVRWTTHGSKGARDYYYDAVTNKTTNPFNAVLY